MRSILIHKKEPSVVCWFRAQKYTAGGTITYEGPWFRNTILNSGLDLLRLYALRPYSGANAGVTQKINVGTGTSEPSVTDTGLDAFVASTSSTYGSLGMGNSSGDVSTSDPCYQYWERTFAFAVGFLGTNTNLTELGLSRVENSNYLNRQLFRDELGDPTVIPVQTDEGLRITCRIYLYGEDAVGATTTSSFDINSVSRPCTIEQLGGDWLTSAKTYVHNVIGHINNTDAIRIATAGGSFVRPDSRSAASYTSGNFYWDVEYTWNPDTFVGDLKRINTYMMGRHAIQGYIQVVSSYNQIVLDDAITIEDTQELKLTLRRSWGRYVEGS